ncbi:MAG: hypothetical protein JW798_02230 [Prolixibacteraceae bacterium]|nr:hypothetical protein [Prolixibacteraceae bacterium]
MTIEEEDRENLILYRLEQADETIQDIDFKKDNIGWIEKQLKLIYC